MSGWDDFRAGLRGERRVDVITRHPAAARGWSPPDTHLVEALRAELAAAKAELCELSRATQTDADEERAAKDRLSASLRAAHSEIGAKSLDLADAQAELATIRAKLVQAQTALSEARAELARRPAATPGSEAARIADRLFRVFAREVHPDKIRPQEIRNSVGYAHHGRAAI